MIKRSEFLRGQLQAYRDAWQKNPDEAMEYWDLQGRIALALSLFRYIELIAERWADLVRAGGREYTFDDAREISAMYRDWLIPSEIVMNQIERAKQLGNVIQGREAFEYAVSEASCAAAIDPERLDAAERQLLAGGGYTIEQALHELQSRPLRRGA